MSLRCNLCDKEITSIKEHFASKEHQTNLKNKELVLSKVKEFQKQQKQFWERVVEK